MGSEMCIRDSYMYGYKSIEVLNQLAKGNKDVIESEFIDIPAQKIQQANVVEFQENLAAMMKGDGN